MCFFLAVRGVLLHTLYQQRMECSMSGSPRAMAGCPRLVFRLLCTCACACSNPNLQNVPTKTGGIVRAVGGGEVDSILDSLNIRSWFTPSRGEGHLLFSYAAAMGLHRRPPP